MLPWRCLRCQGILVKREGSSIRYISLAVSKLKDSRPSRTREKGSEKISYDGTTVPGKARDHVSVDAYNIAEKAYKYLAKGDDSSVMKLIRQNHDLDLTVTWNYLLKYRLEKGRINTAMKDFQAMKKRGHFPNAHTYTIMLNGLSQHFEKMTGASKMRAIVSSLLSDRRITPTVIHLNAVLKASSRVNLDLAYEMLEKFRASGMDTQDGVTYDTLFRCINRTLAEIGTPDPKSDKPLSDVALQHVQDAQDLWKDVEAGWSGGSFTVDAQLIHGYLAILEKGGKLDAQAGLDTIVRFCGLPLYSKAQSVNHLSSNTSGTGLTSKRGRTVRPDAQMVDRLLRFAKLINNVGLTKFYRDYATALPFFEKDNEELYQARIRSLMKDGAPQEAIAILEEMKANKVRINELTIFLALQCHYAHSMHDFPKAVDFLINYADAMQSPKLMSPRVVTTLITLLQRYQPVTDGCIALDRAITIFSSLDWQALAEQVMSNKDQQKHLRSSLITLIDTYDVERRKRLAISRRPAARHTLPREVTTMLSDEAFRQYSVLVGRLTRLQNKLFKDDALSPMPWNWERRADTTSSSKDAGTSMAAQRDSVGSEKMIGHQL